MCVYSAMPVYVCTIIIERYQYEHLLLFLVFHYGCDAYTYNIWIGGYAWTTHSHRYPFGSECWR